MFPSWGGEPPDWNHPFRGTSPLSPNQHFLNLNLMLWICPEEPWASVAGKKNNIGKKVWRQAEPPLM